MLLRRLGFTIVEVLIVIAIILLLSGIFVSVSRGAKLKAHEQACASRLKQIYSALLMYSSDHAGDLLHPQVPISNQGLSRPASLLPYLGDEDILYCPETPVCAKEKLLSTYVWTALPPQGHALRASAERQINEWFTEGMGYPIVHCLVHDELHYYQKEKQYSEILNPPYVIRLLPDGSVHQGRYPIKRGHDIARSCQSQ